MAPFLLEIIVFLSGAGVMILEIVGSRLLLPHVGSSIHVWTGLIGVILASLSAGYALGGKIADKWPSFSLLSLFVCGAGGFIVISVTIAPAFFIYAISIENLPLRTLISSVVIFAPASTLLGMIAPFAARLKIRSLDKAGSTVGGLYALSTVGSIAGTFLAGFYLIPSFGTVRILLFLGVMFMALGAAGYIFGEKRQKGMFVLLMGISVIGSIAVPRPVKNSQVVYAETRYNRTWTFDGVGEGGLRMRNLITSPYGILSQMIVDERSEERITSYFRYFRLANHFTPNISRALMLGGGALVYPEDFLKRNPEATMDVVEIDPGLTALAKEHFGFETGGGIKVYHTDGRIYLNEAEPEKRYDAIFLDAFVTCYPPAHLASVEALRVMRDRLNDGGVIIGNYIGAFEGPGSEFMHAQYRTFRSVFPHVYLLRATPHADEAEFQNIILIALKSEKEHGFASENPEFAGYLAHAWKDPIPAEGPIFTDDYGPVEYLPDCPISPYLARLMLSAEQ